MFAYSRIASKFNVRKKSLTLGESRRSAQHCDSSGHESFGKHTCSTYRSPCKSRQVACRIAAWLPGSTSNPKLIAALQPPNASLTASLALPALDRTLHHPGELHRENKLGCRRC